MGNFVVSTIQQQVSIYDTLVEYQADIFRFFQKAKDHGAQLAVLPALSPLMLVPPLASETMLDQLKREQDKGGMSGLMGRLFGKEPSDSKEKGGSIQDELVHLLTDYPGEIYEAYIDLFSAAALKYQMTIVAGSFFLRENEEADCSHVAYVFGPNGMVLGRQEKIYLSHREAEFCDPGNALKVIETPVAQIGILIGEDVLFPEYSRVLAYNGVEVLINLTASAGETTFNQHRHAFRSRVEENEIMGVQSCLVGYDMFNVRGPNLTGKSSLLAPFPMSKQADGILAEVSNGNLEGFISEPMDLELLKDFWAQSRPRRRKDINLSAVQPLVTMYEHQRTIDQAYWNPPEDASGDASTRPVLAVDTQANDGPDEPKTEITKTSNTSNDDDDMD